MRRFLSIAIRALTLLLVALLSAMGAMRLAIHGRKVLVPQLVGLTPAQAQQTAVGHGLILVNEGKFYSASVPMGRIMSQMPLPASEVRRGWRVRVAESLGAQRAAVPNLIGQSIHAAEINVSRRGLELGTMAQADIPNASPGGVLAQSPSADVQNVRSPRVSLLTASSAAADAYVMPNLVGKRLSEVLGAVEQAGLMTPRIQAAPVADGSNPLSINPSLPSAVTPASSAEMIVRQTPAAGTKISKETQITLQLAR